MRVRIAVAAALLFLLAGVIALLSSHASTLAYENGKQVDFPLLVPPGGRFCEDGQFVPKGARHVRLWISTGGKRGGPVYLIATQGGALVALGKAPGGYVDQPVDIPLDPGVKQDFYDARVCVTNASSIRVGYMGDPATGRVNRYITVPGQRPRQVMNPSPLDVVQGPGVVSPRIRHPSGAIVARLEWHTAGAGSWWGRIPTLAKRAALLKPSFVGTWTLWFLGFLMLGLGVVVIRTITREASR